MNMIRNHTNNFINLNYIAILIFLISLFLLITITLAGNLAPIILYVFMIVIGTLLIIIFSNKDEIFLKIKLFVFFFSLILIYTLVNHYVLISFFPKTLPFLYADGPTFYKFSNLALPFISGKKSFFDLFTFAAYPMHDLPLHVMFSATISYFSNLIDGSNTIIIQKLLSPFFGGIFSVVLYSTLKYQFKDTSFALNATFAYTLLSAVFIYSTSLMRDIDIALAYMIFIYIFLQPSAYKNFFLLLLVAFITTYIRPESGLVLYGITLVYAYLYIRKVQSKSIKSIFYILLAVLFSIVFLLSYSKISERVVNLSEGNTKSLMAKASADSIAVKFNKLPFPLSYVAKMSFGQMQPFPLIKAIDRPPEAISGIFWPFIFIMMVYAWMKKNIRVLIDIKVKYLLMIAIALLFIMSSEPMARRMMSVYPIIYIVSLYIFLIVPKNKIKRIFFSYLFVIISLNVFYYLIKI